VLARFAVVVRPLPPIRPVHDDRASRPSPGGGARRPALPPRTRARVAVAVTLATFVVAAAAAEAAPAAPPTRAGAALDDPVQIAAGRYDGGCAPDPDTGTTYCGALDAAAPEAAALRSEPPVARTLAGVGAGSQSAIEDAMSTVGLSDQNDPAVVDPWRDPRATSTRGLRLREGRLVVPWNAYARAKAANAAAPASTATRAGRDLDRSLRILRAMKQGGFNDPLISFERQRDFRTNARVPSQPLPSPAEYIAAVAGFVEYVGRLEAAGGAGEDYPRLRRFTAWNEPNNRTQPTAADGFRAGQFFRALAEQSATPADAAAFGRYFQAYCDGMDGRRDGRCGYRPLAWAIHPYSCGYRRDTTGVRAFAALTAARSDGAASPDDPLIWLTEAGGVVSQHFNADPDGRSVPRRTLVARADGDLAFVLDDCVAVSPRITRLYVYQWAGAENVDPAGRRDRGFNAGLTDLAGGSSGDPRRRYAISPLYCTLKAAVNPGPCATAANTGGPALSR
jgi:hypothetical protein